MYISRPINNASIRRKEKREAAAIAAELERLTKEFISYVKIHCQHIVEMENMGVLFKDSNVSAVYLNYESDWKQFCKRKWLYNKTRMTAFEECVKANFHLTGIKIKKHD